MFRATAYFIWTLLGMLDTPKDPHTFRKIYSLSLLTTITFRSWLPFLRRVKSDANAEDHCYQNFVAKKCNYTSSSRYGDTQLPKRVRTYCTCSGDFGYVMSVSGIIVLRRRHVFHKASQLDMLKICRRGDLATYKWWRSRSWIRECYAPLKWECYAHSCFCG